MNQKVNRKAKFTALVLSLSIAAFAAITSLVLGQVPAPPYRLSDKEVETIIRGVEGQANTFRQSLRAALNKSHFNGSRREDDINAFVKDFDRETKRLHDHFDHHKSTGGDIQSVLNRAAEIDRFMIRNRLTPRAHNDWNGLRSNLERLAEVYGVSWGWSENISSGAIVVDLPVVAIITSSGSTNVPAYRISLSRGGRAEVARRNSLTTKDVPAALAERFFADLTAAMPLAQLPTAQPCFKSSAFGGSIYITFANQRSPDLSCASGPRVVVLSADVAAIKQALNVN